MNVSLVLFIAAIKVQQLPAIETVLKASNSKSTQRVPPIDVLILCPTRELASQIAAEANVLLKYHESIGVQTLVGGTRFKEDQKRLESNPCQVYLRFVYIRTLFQFMVKDELNMDDFLRGNSQALRGLHAEKCKHVSVKMGYNKRHVKVLPNILMTCSVACMYL